MSMKRSIPTLTIGIPAYNEEHSIPALLQSIYEQEQKGFIIKSVLVIIDCSTDGTLDVVRKWKTRLPQLTIVKRKVQKGKAEGLNLIYQKSQTDFLLTIDADTFFEDKTVLQKLVQSAVKRPHVNLVSSRHKPLMPSSVVGKFAAYSYLIVEDAFLRINNGNNFYAVMSMELLPKHFYKSFQFPSHTQADQCYVYATATKNSKNGFLLVKNAFIRFQPVSTIHDWRVLSVRSVRGDKEDITSRFGDDVLSSYSMTTTHFLKSAMRLFLRSPIYVAGAMILNVYIRLFPYKKLTKIDGKWETTTSSKQLAGI